MAYLDRTADDPPIRWQVTITVRVPDAPAIWEESLVANMSATVGAVDVKHSSKAIDSSNAIALSFDLKGRLHDEVQRAARAMRMGNGECENAGRSSTGRLDARAGAEIATS
jgi:hypothetical protein